jgi:murein DD-endopeptidase MepM/ murein hydrolase activator NlpD
MRCERPARGQSWRPRSTALWQASHVDHGDGVRTLWAHLSQIKVVEGGVERGDVIGLAGSTGLSASVYLHFETVRNGSLVDPMSLIETGEAMKQQ